MAEQIEIAAVTHDLQRRRSLLLVTWPNDPERRLSLPIPFGTPTNGLESAGRAAIQALVAELGRLELTMPADPR